MGQGRQAALSRVLVGGLRRRRRRLRVRALESFECLVEIRRGSPRKPPLFLTCWTGGKLIAYHDLVQRLPDDQPIYGLRAPRFDGRRLRFTTIEELARIFVAEMRRLQPEPPYFLAGYCFGGTLAHEMACQLEADGASTGFLGLIESSPYGHGAPKRPRPRQLEREAAWFRMFVQEPLSRKLLLLAGRLFGRWSRWRRGLRNGAYALVLRTGWRWPGRLWNLNLIAIRRALRDYAVRPSRARIVLLEAHDPRLGPLPPTVWARLAGGVDVYPVTAIGVGHVSIMWQPYVDQLSAIFQEQLALAMQLAAPFLGG